MASLDDGRLRTASQVRGHSLKIKARAPVQSAEESHSWKLELLWPATICHRQLGISSSFDRGSCPRRQKPVVQSEPHSVVPAEEQTSEPLGMHLCGGLAPALRDAVSACPAALHACDWCSDEHMPAQTGLLSRVRSMVSSPGCSSPILQLKIKNRFDC